jgi:hypothetical protein
MIVELLKNPPRHWFFIGRPADADRSLRRQLMKEAAYVSTPDLAGNSVVVLGRDNPVLLPPMRARGFCIAVMKNPWKPRRVVVVTNPSAWQTTRVLRRSPCSVSGHEVRGKAMAESARGIAVLLLPQALPERS